MVKVTIEHDEGVETFESNAVFVACMTDNGKSVNVKSGAWGELPADEPGYYFIQAAGDGMRSIVRAIGDNGVKDAESEFLIGFIGNTLDGLNGDSLIKLHRFFGREGEQK